MERFKKYYEIYYDDALKEIKNGHKVSHWMWYIFPQIDGLGKTKTSKRFAIKNEEEAKEFLEDDYLREHISNLCVELIKLDKESPREIFSYIDALKLRSSMTLFDYTAKKNNIDTDIFYMVLDKYYGGIYDELTIQILDEMKNKEYYLKY